MPQTSAPVPGWLIALVWVIGIIVIVFMIFVLAIAAHLEDSGTGTTATIVILIVLTAMIGIWIGGEKIEPVMCHNCSKEFAGNVKICPYCHSPRAEESSEPTAIPTPSETQVEELGPRWWITRRNDLIAALERSGHSLGFTTQRQSTGEGGGGYLPAIRCKKCGAKYRGPILRRWWGLSPNRPCEGGDRVWGCPRLSDPPEA